jgi:C-5 cytosine-specific DNA methylase
MTCTKPTVIDLYCGLGGWSEGFLAEGYECHGYDIEAHDYGTGGYPGTLHLRDILTIHGSEFKDATVIVGSSPCQKYSYMAMPWTKAKDMARFYADAAHPERIVELNALFDAQFRIQREASEAAGRYIPMVVENVRGAQKWVGQAQWHYGSFYLWGDVPALMPMTLEIKAPGKNWNEWKNWDGTEGNKSASVRPWGDAATKNDGSGWRENGTLKSCNRMVPDGRKVGGTDLRKVGFNVAAVRKMLHGDPNMTNAEGRKEGGDWWNKECRKTGMAQFGSKSPQRKMASAMIAKIPFPLAQHIAYTFKQIPVDATPVLARR